MFAKIRISERRTKENVDFFVLPSESIFEAPASKIRISERRTKENEIFFVFPSGSIFDVPASKNKNR